MAISQSHKCRNEHEYERVIFILYHQLFNKFCVFLHSNNTSTTGKKEAEADSKAAEGILTVHLKHSKTSLEITT